ncbi:transposase [Nonomuraea jabiensis]|uniref:Transposase-like protein n=1 Tax=Nonomuraea jabiensis TaxID=882448 RepID=A0A7W9L9D6_9ACTN|nr:transposase [Nonomuraea jabiensis]MBB5775378.1 transposase-like protein [Nonomuraea jabiensis]
MHQIMTTEPAPAPADVPADHAARVALVTAVVLVLTWLALARSGFAPRPDAAALYLSDPARALASVAQDLGISRETLRNWVRQAQTDGTAGAKQTGPAKKPASGVRRAEVAVVQCLGRVGRHGQEAVERPTESLGLGAGQPSGRDQPIEGSCLPPRALREERRSRSGVLDGAGPGCVIK